MTDITRRNARVVFTMGLGLALLGMAALEWFEYHVDLGVALGLFGF